MYDYICSFFSSKQSADNAGFSSSGGGPSSTQSCPANPVPKSTEPCQVDQLKVEVIEEDDYGEKEPKQTVTWTHANRNKKYSAEVVKALSGADMVIQTVSDNLFRDRGGSPRTLKVTNATSPACKKSEHPEFTFKKTGKRQKATKFQTTAEDLDIPSEPNRRNVVDGFFETYWPFGKGGKRTYTVISRSCGIAKTATETAPAAVTCRVEAYRNNSLKLSIEPPAFMEKKHAIDVKLTTEKLTREVTKEDKSMFDTRSEEHKTETVTEGDKTTETVEVNREGGGATASSKSETVTEGGIRTTESSSSYEDARVSVNTESRTTSGPDGFSSSSRTDAQSGERRVITSEELRSGADYVAAKRQETQVANGIVYDRIDAVYADPSLRAAASRQTLIVGNPIKVIGEDKGTEIEEESFEDIESRCKLEFNGESHDFDKYIHRMIELPNRFSKFVEEMKEAVPQVGWSAEASLVVLAGNIGFEWELAEKDAAECDVAWLVDAPGKIKIDCEVIKGGLTASFGIDWVIENLIWDPPLVECILKISATLEVTCKMEAEWNFPDDGEFKVEPGIESIPDVTATARAMVNGIGCSAEAKLEMGLGGQFTFEGSADKTPNLSGEVYSVPFSLTAETEFFGEKYKSELFSYPENRTKIWEGEFMTPAPKAR